MIIFGPPGAGKGTQAENIVKKMGVVHLSTGDMLRAAVAAETAMGLKAKEKMDKGELVEDDIVVGIIRERIAETDCHENGFLLDGYPRTVPQAEALDEMLGHQLALTHILNLKVSKEMLEERITGRRIHKASGRSYHIKFKPPKTPMVDDVTGEPLIQRDDDTAEALVNRLEKFEEETIPVLKHYKPTGIIIDIDGSTNDRDAVWELVEGALDINNAVSLKFNSEDFSAKNDGEEEEEEEVRAASRLSMLPVVAMAEDDEETPEAAPIFRIIMFGPPGSGKRTQSWRIQEHFKNILIEVDELIEAEIKAETKYGNQARACQEKGYDIDDEVVMKILEKRLNQEDVKENGFTLHHFPKSIHQSRELDTLLKLRGDRITHVLNFHCPDEVLKKRLKEDSKHALGDEEIESRLQKYHENTECVLSHYMCAKGHLVYEINGMEEIETTWKKVHDVLRKCMIGIEFNKTMSKHQQNTCGEDKHAHEHGKGLDEETLQHYSSVYRDIFQRIDADGDGGLSQDEISQAMSRKSMIGDHGEILKLMEELSTNEDGNVSLDTFIALVAGDTGITVDEDDVKEAFVEADINRNGRLYPAEILNFMRSLGDDEITLEDAEMMVEGVNDNGYIEYEEFKRVVMAADYI